MMFQFRISNCFREVIALRQVLVVCAYTTPENLKNKASYRFSCFFLFVYFRSAVLGKVASSQCFTSHFS